MYTTQTPANWFAVPSIGMAGYHQTPRTDTHATHLLDTYLTRVFVLYPLAGRATLYSIDQASNR
jgi:hypothetical protein